MRKEDSYLKAVITTIKMAKFGRNETIHRGIHLQIGRFLKCKIDDRLEIVREDQNDSNFYSIFDSVSIRSVWDEDTSHWWLRVVDVIEALSLSSSPRIYWATLKRRNPQLIAICKQLKLMAKDGKNI